jgi:uncharacterized RDD family membrane protein YckC
MSDLPPPPPPSEGDRPPDRAAGRVLPYPAFPPTQRDEMPSEGPGALVAAGLRFGGAAIDYLLFNFVLVGILGPVLGLRVHTSSGKNATTTVTGPVWIRVFLTVLPIVLIALFLGLRGQTPGMMLLKMRLVRYIDGTQPNMQETLTRTVVLFAPLVVLSAIVPVLGLIGLLATVGIGISANFDAVLRGIHDKAAGTIVLRTR